ncbi:MAG: hypothetical protein V2I43_27595 [Parvularcula sp.]|jgi:hypothetical protein|nr:hypothetical protein [Parvularcula sp.]
MTDITEAVEDDKTPVADPGSGSKLRLFILMAVIGAVFAVGW